MSEMFNVYRYSNYSIELDKGEAFFMIDSKPIAKLGKKRTFVFISIIKNIYSDILKAQRPGH